MSRRFDCADPAQREEGINHAVSAIRMGQLIVLPTDTVYGVGADAFDRNAVTDLLLAKGRGRDMPPPVLVGSVRAGEALIDDLGHYGRDLIAEFWPGALTLVCRATPTLNWDLGETKGTVAVRMPLHPVALEILRETGPLAVSSANMSGNPAATTADDAQKQLGSAIEVYLDGGPTEGPDGLHDHRPDRGRAAAAARRGDPHRQDPRGDRRDRGPAGARARAARGRGRGRG